MMFDQVIYDLGFLTASTIIFVVIPYFLLKLYSERVDRLEKIERDNIGK